MGDPAELSAAERAHLFAFAEDVVDATRNDLVQPTLKFLDGDPMDWETAIFKLAQLVLSLRDDATSQG